MILITAYGKIESIVISKELKIKICNPSDKEIEELQDALEEECLLRKHLMKLQKKRGIQCNEVKQYDLKLFTKKMGWYEKKKLKKIIAEHLIKIQTTDSPSCEMDNAERFMYFCNFLEPNPCFPHIAYRSDPSSHRKPSILEQLIAGKYLGENDAIIKLQKLGSEIDTFLQDEQGRRSSEEFWLFDYIVDALKYYHGRENAYKIFKLMSLIEMLIINPNSQKTQEKMKEKLPCFLENIEACNREIFADQMRVLRNKIAHGDYSKVQKVLFEYQKKFTPNLYANPLLQDIDEYGIVSGTYLDISYHLEQALRNILKFMIQNKNKWKNLRHQ